MLITAKYFLDFLISFKTVCSDTSIGWSRAGLGPIGHGILAQTGPQPSNQNTVAAPDQRKMLTISAHKTTNIHKGVFWFEKWGGHKTGVPVKYFLN